MNQAVNFILESGISLALLSTIYILFLRRETFFKLNRLFLLISLVFSILLPFLKLKVYDPQPMLLAEVTVTPYKNLMAAVTIYGQDLSGTVIQTISSSQIIILIYLAGFMFFFSRMAFRISQIIFLVLKNNVQVSGQYKFVFLNRDFSPFSFLHFIFINPEQREKEGYDKMVAHEMEHIRQGHTFDVLILEILTVFQWFNPFMWLLKKVVRENHEFLADSAVLNSGVNVGQYKKLLLNQFMGFELSITNGFNSSLVKKRIKMISKIRSSKYANLKYAFGIATVLSLIVTFACEQNDSIEMVLEKESPEMRIEFIGEKLRVDASNENLDRLKKIFAGKVNINLEADSLGNLFFVKNNLEPKFLDPNEKIYQLVNEMPKYPGGEDALRSFISESVKYPAEAISERLSGKVYVSFVISENGEVANCEVVRGVAESLDTEALRVVNSLPKWTPGKMNGRAVNVQYTVPISFRLNSDSMN